MGAPGDDLWPNHKSSENVNIYVTVLGKREHTVMVL